ncbi:hypothetical protein DFJ58DRAFT_684876 [Suillus subalutaceus]|uniref:uncharacterized protein n=1 Tax=Suillus subalutaceus TaxID=48586 RepID=UPI001B870D15|nr:uncharacterized protein DFJ58DRAFT_684876 [Suillus subalutaceus]KAG1851445.1 hypothetical protein DFJ58DRAFT_684876 [Suillus subalutaceus]
MRLLICVFLYLVGVIQAANTTTTTTSDNFKVPSASFSTRTLWTIISSSGLTLFACIYSAIHTNIPSPEDSPLRILWRRFWIMIMALIVPELMVAWAVRQWLCTHQVTKQFEESGYYPSVPEKKEFFLVRWVKRLIEVYVSKQSEDYTWTQTHSFFVLMGGFMLYVDREPCLTLRSDDILKLIREGHIDAPTLTEKQIGDKSKGNAISKGLIILQVAWFVMQLITRAIYHLETTQLEVGTLAFAVLDFLTYAAWWNKPLGVECPHPVYWKSTNSKPEDVIDDFNERDKFAQFWILALVSPIHELLGLSEIPTSRKLRVPTFDGSIKLEGSNKWVLQLAALLMATIFGAIHGMAWFFAFRTYREQLLWRMSAIAVTFTPWLCFVLHRAGIYIHPFVQRARVFGLNFFVFGSICMVFGLIIIVSAIVYITARAVLLVLMFTTLRDLPPGAHKAVAWTSLVPHL